MARTVTDVALLLQALAGYDPSDPGTVDAPVPSYADSLGGDLTGQCLAVPTNWFFDRIEPDVRALLEAGELIYATDYIRALRARELIKQAWRDDTHSLPIGMQIIGRPSDEPGVLRVGSVFEATTDFASACPPDWGEHPASRCYALARVCSDAWDTTARTTTRAPTARA